MIPRDKGGQTTWENIVCSCMDSIDLIILINGLPLLTMEVKNEFTGQTHLGDSVRWGSMGFDKSWGLRAKNRSSNFTTDWNALPVAHAA